MPVDETRPSALPAQQAMLEKAAGTYRRNSKQDNIMRRLCARALDPWLRADGIGLEIGCSDGLMSEMLARRLQRLDVVEATETFLTDLRQRKLANVTIHHAMIEEFETDQRYSFVFATWVLTHFVDPKAVWERVKRWLAPDALLFVVVPNVRVLSRQLALHMGLIDDLFELTENDRNHGHVRSYDRQELNRELAAGGFETVAQGGLMLKPLADFQMDQLYDTGVLEEAHVEGLYRLGCLYPDFASAIYSICRASR
jgi:2-polyprenyl-3-methyl-5-hydroxy-6-metoxy-1,4-benzoquinol methylase